METKTKPCSTCKDILPLEDFYPHKRMRLGRQPNCKNCSRQWHRDRPDYIRLKNAQFKEKYPKYHLNWQRKSKYGLSPDDIEEIRVKQDRKCPGCKQDLLIVKECVDHDHSTGLVRGLLCDDCNVALGRLKDNSATLLNLAAYLKENYL